MTITEDLHIDCPPATAFDVMADARNESQWNDGVSFTFTDAGSGTLVHGTFEPKPKGIMAALFPLLRPMVRRDMVK